MFEDNSLSTEMSGNSTPAAAISDDAARIAALEQQVAEAQQVVTAADFYDQPFDVTGPALENFETLKGELDAAGERWLELEEKSEQLRAAASRGD